MENQRIIIIIGLLFTGFLLWQEWTLYKNPNKTISSNANSNISSQPITRQQDNTNNENSDIPNIKLESNISVIDNQQVADNVLVTTDLFNLSISKKGGTIDKLSLNNYPISIDDKDNKVYLFNDKIGNLLQAQSGLLPADKLPTHISIFTSDNKQYDLGEEEELTVPLYWGNNKGIEVVKEYKFKRNNYIININYKITNNSNETLYYTSYVQLLNDKIVADNIFLPTFNGGAIYNDNDIFEKIDFEDFTSTQPITSIGGWIAIVQHYFVSAWIPNQTQKQTYSTKKSQQGGYLISALNNNTAKIASGESVNLIADRLYVGPKIQKNISKITGLDKTVDYGVLYIIAKPLEIVMHTINDFINSWGYAIILLTILIKLIFYKLSETSYRSMAKMRKLTPKMQNLKERYGDDKQKISKKMMELYKKEKVNPATGCLPILVQIPVFIALYWVLLESVELRQVSFWWLPDLSSKDPFFILPVVMGASMFAQQKLNPPPPDPTQAKVMMMLPFIFTIFFLWMPSGLVLYWVINNLLSILQQWIINKRLSV